MSPRLQAALLSTLLAGTAVFAYLGVSRIGYQHLAVKRQVAAIRARTANSDLEKRVDGLQQTLAALVRERDSVRSAAASLADQAGALRSQLSSAEAKLQSQDDTQQALDRQQTQNAALAAQLDKIKKDRSDEEAQLAQSKASLEEAARKLAQLSALGGKITIKRGRAHLELGEIQRTLSQIQLPPAETAMASTGSAASADTAASNRSAAPASNVGNLGPDAVAAVERALRSAGVDVPRILAQFSKGGGEGGPFVPLPKADGAATADATGPDKLAAIKALVNTLPIAAPLAHYQIGSPFGPRIDPFNRRPAFHTGIDMDAPYSSPVYATAPGRVIYSGWLGDYGRVVELDHGFGIVTLYAHLRRCLVAVAQTVAAQVEIGLVGMTGRSTGPHVHYEVRVDGQPQDPEKFLGLARLLPAAVTRPLTPAAGGPAENSR